MCFAGNCSMTKCCDVLFVTRMHMTYVSREMTSSESSEAVNVAARIGRFVKYNWPTFSLH
jgi:hypothetical protein